MANLTMNSAKGRAISWAENVATNSPVNSAIIAVLLTANETDATLIDYDTLNTLLAAAGNTEATFTNYSRLVLDDTQVSVVFDDTADEARIQLASNPTWTSAGGASNETISKLIFAYVPDSTSYTDAQALLISHHDFVDTTNGNNLVGTLTASTIHTAT